MLMHAGADPYEGVGYTAASGEGESRESRAYDDSGVPADVLFQDFQEFEAAFLRERATYRYGDTLSRKIALLEMYIGRLQQLASLTTDEYERDWVRRCAVERTLEQAMDTCISLTRHTIAERGLRTPATFADTFVMARNASLIEPALAATLVRMCGFRNRLVHEGEFLDTTVVLDVLHTRLDDFVQFVATARRWM